MSGTDKATGPIQALLDERLKVLQWLDRLNMAGDETPQEVRDRVRADYQARLDNVARQLEGYKDELQEQLIERQRSHDTLAEREKASEAQLAEAKLRHAVGEFGEEKWNELHSEIMSGLVEVREVLQSTDAEIQRLEEVLALIRQKPPSTEVRRAIPMPEPPPPPAPAPTAVAPAPSPPPPGADRMAEAPTAQSKAFDELAFLKSVTDDEDLGPAPSRASGRSVTHGADAISPPPPPPPAPVSPGRGFEPSSQESGPKKTLKCGECGVMNFPTEWYCERCGAELAAL